MRDNFFVKIISLMFLSKKLNAILSIAQQIYFNKSNREGRFFLTHTNTMNKKKAFKRISIRLVLGKPIQCV